MHIKGNCWFNFKMSKEWWWWYSIHQAHHNQWGRNGRLQTPMFKRKHHKTTRLSAVSLGTSEHWLKFCFIIWKISVISFLFSMVQLLSYCINPQCSFWLMFIHLDLVYLFLITVIWYCTYILWKYSLYPIVFILEKVRNSVMVLKIVSL